ncbi:lysophospholipid acyltransferase family protein [Stella sp.]|uniref:lysophospholipid acyltransferase family protein n=1 Tax=Stella sp. TaxID=2912054 RepID=UPI0035B10C44
MTIVRSAAFNAAFFLWTIALALLTWPAIFLPRAATVAVYRFWAAGVARLAAAIVGIRSRWIGLDRAPPGPVIYAAKHQSAWDTIMMPGHLDAPAVVLKQELLRIPIYGGFVRRWGAIPVDRKAGARALRGMVADARALAAAGRSILIYPQGTRVAPSAEGAAAPYQPGVAALYAQLGLPVVPVALDSGLCWGRRAFFKRPGTITVELLPAIPPGLDRREFLQRLERETEAATARLLRDAGGQGTPESRG